MPEVHSPNGWTMDTLERYLTDKIEALDRFCVTNFAQGKERVDMALAASDKAIGKAELATEKRFEGVNEFRQTLADQAARLMPRAEYTVQHDALVERVNSVAADVADLKSISKGKLEGVQNIGTIVTVCSLAVAAVMAIITVVVIIYFRGGH